MYEYLKQLLYDPTVNKFLVAIIGLLIVIIVSRFIRSSITRYVKGVDTRYRLRKFINFTSYILSFCF